MPDKARFFFRLRTTSFRVDWVNRGRGERGNQKSLFWALNASFDVLELKRKEWRMKCRKTFPHNLISYIKYVDFFPAKCVKKKLCSVHKKFLVLLLLLFLFTFFYFSISIFSDFFLFRDSADLIWFCLVAFILILSSKLLLFYGNLSLI